MSATAVSLTPAPTPVGFPTTTTAAGSTAPVVAAAVPLPAITIMTTMTVYLRLITVESAPMISMTVVTALPSMTRIITMTVVLPTPIIMVHHGCYLR